ncbi:MAG: GNAT family N-acetyltransferase [archaeon]
MRQIGKQIIVSKASLRDILNLNRAWVENQTILGMITSAPPSLANIENAFVVKIKGSDEIIGFAQLNMQKHEKYNSAELGTFVIRRDFSRKGIGKKLLGTVNAFLIKKEAKFA